MGSSNLKMIKQVQIYDVRFVTKEIKFIEASPDICLIL
jgi:hypothetical protein